MRFKVVPEPRDVAFLTEARQAVPLVPGSVEDCCTRLRDATDLPSRDEAREWLTFLQALELVRETDRGFERTRSDPDRAALADAFERRVFGAREVLDALDDGPLTVDGAFERLRGDVPAWERNRSPDWEREWRDRVERLLEWCVRFDLAERGDDGVYHRVG